MKRYIKNLMMGVAAVLTLSSCGNDWLDLDPEGTPGEGSAIENSTDLKTARTGMYAALRGSNTQYDYYGAGMFLYGDVHADDMQANLSGGGTNRAVFHYAMQYTTASDFTRTNTPWQSPYVVISRANRIIAAADNGNLSDRNKEAAAISQYRSEALVLRAMALFDLTRIYGKPYTMDQGASLGVPVVTTVVDMNYKPKRSTVAQCYQQVLADLTGAIASEALPTDKTQGYVNLWAAKALLARVYITMGNDREAYNVCKDIIEHSPYRLWEQSEYATAWNKTNAAHTNEMMLEMVMTGVSDWVDREGIAYLYSENYTGHVGYGDVVVTKAFADLLEADPQDVRNNVLYASTAAKNKTLYGTHRVWLNKMPAVNSDCRYSNVPLLRLSEVYLTGAEAALNINEKADAAAWLDAIITRRTSDATLTVTADNITSNRIYTERRKELVGEGQRYFDCLRRGETITRFTSDADQGWHGDLITAARSFDRTSTLAYPAIPQYERNGNPNIEQNEGY